MSAGGPTLCLNMIVRNEAHVVHEVLDSVAPYISSWVIVDTGSTDGTQDRIRAHMAGLGIAGELHERPWRDFGHNRSEAIALARGHADYIWVMDADDLVVGTPDFTHLDADVYQLHYGPDVSYWRRQLFRDGLPWHYIGVLHEYAECGQPCHEERLDGHYHIESRRLGGRNLDPDKYARDAEILLAEVGRNPDDPRSVFYLAQSYFDYRDFASAHRWYARRAEMGGFDEEVYYALTRVGDCLSNLGEPWPAALDAYLRAWEFRPTRAEALHSIARRYREDQRHQLGHLFAERAASIPLPEQDVLFVNAEVYTWRARDEQAVCASWIDKSEQTFDICSALLRRTDIPEEDRQRIAANRDVGIAAALERVSTLPADARIGGVNQDVTMTLVAGPGRAATDRTLTTVLNCFSDLSRVARVVAFDIGIWPEDKAELAQRYPFVEFRPAAPGLRPPEMRAAVTTRFWLHLCMGWQFFTRDDYVERLTSILDVEPDIGQVGINYCDADRPIGAVAPQNTIRDGARTGRYLLAEQTSRGPAMFDCTRWIDEMPYGSATLTDVSCILQS